MKRVLITGANGFVARHLSKMLLAEGWIVRGAVRSEQALEQLGPSLEGFVVGSIDSDTDWNQALEGVDAVVHLAARVHVLDDTASDPLNAYRNVNVHGTRRLLETCSSAGVKRFVFMSSVKAVGEGHVKPVAYTEADPCKPEDPYGISKAEAEELVLEYTLSGTIEGVILRPPMVYGPGVKANLLRLIRGIEAGIPFPLAMVRNQRSMIYVNNLSDAVKTCLVHPKAPGQVFFVADDEVLSTPELITLLAGKMGKRARLIPVPVSILRLLFSIIGRKGEIDRLTGSLVVSTKKIKQELGWKPPWTLEAGLTATIESYLRESTKAQK